MNMQTRMSSLASDTEARASERALRRAAESVIAGRTGLLTLTANATSTTLTLPLIRASSPVHLQPTTITAAQTNNAWYIVEATRVNGSVTIVHDATPATDRIFRYWIG